MPVLKHYLSVLLSSLVSEVFLARLKEELSSADHPQFSIFVLDIYQWHGFVDDIFCMRTETEASLQAIRTNVQQNCPQDAQSYCSKKEALL